ncbi:Pimeloyl-ACP methyl ester carboxylesterase [Actinokineospora alba]|uniref:Pimeloyl-ACP methyl ester carboxylesterase n=1 Tax=Actinokineospora alba TaxID=504798 RepID=A0A1H0T3C3_9PSEU|nr:alpha/beta hydrolase [Actinokineospora alba]TDP66387.1 pimeloyl-ACP methyl ester carboxylesterase [Actinokineospora alba]SDJ23722.1 Pimeloyl-ACP methyl ester carboxylesterase [Actinokineospora alba]SDP48489.1 Pimeloyl-ACP methyl ester carboxylesterase [Actinokineospora alba]
MPGADPLAVTLRFKDIHGHRRAYRMGGSGPVLLFIHGISDSSETWRDVLPDLAERYTVIAPDLLGHGDSDKPRADYAAAAYACGMRDLLAVLDIDKVTVVGHSLGAGVAMQFAYQFPERCERLVLVSGGGAGRAVHPLLRLAAGPWAEAVIPLAVSRPVNAIADGLLAVLPRLPVSSHTTDLTYVLQRYRLLRERRARAAFLRTLRAVVDHRGQVVTMLDRSYLAVGMPTLLIWGARDRIVPAAHAEVAQAALPGSRLEMFPDSGHFPHHDDPARFVKLIDEFLEGTDPAEYDPARWRDILRGGRPD